MKIIGLGTDITEVDRISSLLTARGDRFRERICSAEELLAAAGRMEQAAFFAGRWAAKEAAAKALGCGIGKECALTDIIILNNSSGAPEMHFAGAAAARAAAIGVKEISLSISHEARFAVATVILCG